MRTKIASVFLILALILSVISPTALAEGTGGTETINIIVNVVWDDNENQDGLRPEHVEVQVYANEEQTDEQLELGKENHWAGSVEMQKNDMNGEEIRYTVKETDEPEEYSVQVEGDAATGFTITNYHEPETIDVHVTVVWDDEENADLLRPASVSVDLLADGVKIDNAVLNEEAGWEHHFPGVPKYSDGNEIIYRIQEEVIKPYSVTITESNGSCFVVTNSYHSQKYTVTYDLAGGSSAAAQLVYSGLKNGDITPRITEPTREGWTFAGWEPSVADTVTADVIYIAQWEQSVPVMKEVSIEKQVDADRADVGDVLTYTICVTNTGNVPLENVVMIDDMLEKTETIAQLNVGEDASFTYTYTVPYRDGGTMLVNTAAVWLDGENFGEDSCSTWIDVWERPSYIPPVRPQLNKEEHFAYVVGKEDGLVHPLAPITRAETATIFFRLLTEESRQEYGSQENHYVDVSSDAWYNNAVSTLTNAGILVGQPGNRFAPEDNITRGEFAALVVRFFRNGEVEVEENCLTDVKGHWAEKDINAAYALGLITGYPDDSFHPDQEITRAEAMVLVNRVLERHPDKDHLLPDMITWPDNMDPNAWYYADIQEATNSHVCIMKTRKDGEKYEVWKQLLEVRDWAALELVRVE